MAKRNKQKFKIPVEWAACGVVEIEASSLEEAVQIFDDTIDDIPLPEAFYVDGSFFRCEEGEGSTKEETLEYYKLFNK